MAAVVALCRNGRSGPVFDALTRAMLARDPMTVAHAQRVRQLALALTEQLRINDRRLLDAIEHAALLHDIGKLGIPDRVLDKPGPLTAEEYEQVKLHSALGADLLAAVPLPAALPIIVRHHHEHWDGSGYPDGLRGHAIPIGARIVAIADCYDALTSDRPYRRAMAHDEAMTLIRRGRSTQFDPLFTDALVAILQERSQPRRRVASAALPLAPSPQPAWMPEPR